MFAALEAVRDAVADCDYAGVAISMPGRIDTAAGIAYTGGAFSWLHDYPAAERYGAVFGKPATVANDGKCAAYAESWQGALKDASSGAAIVLGTGVGGGHHEPAGHARPAALRHWRRHLRAARDDRDHQEGLRRPVRSAGGLHALRQARDRDLQVWQRGQPDRRAGVSPREAGVAKERDHVVGRSPRKCGDSTLTARARQRCLALSFGCDGADPLPLTQERLFV
ncbi:MAG: ROK family protein [Atopobiaceae bacterium]|nr:ROK family protein [Atopobiaceae bacterium]